MVQSSRCINEDRIERRENKAYNNGAHDRREINQAPPPTTASISIVGTYRIFEGGHDLSPCWLRDKVLDVSTRSRKSFQKKNEFVTGQGWSKQACARSQTSSRAAKARATMGNVLRQARSFPAEQFRGARAGCLSVRPSVCCVATFLSTDRTECDIRFWLLTTKRSRDHITPR